MMKTVTCYTVRYRLNGQWHYSPLKMPLDYADSEYVITEWEPLLETAEEMPFSAEALKERDSAPEFRRKVRTYSSSMRDCPSNLKWTGWGAKGATDKDWNALNAIWRRCKDRLQCQEPWLKKARS